MSDYYDIGWKRWDDYTLDLTCFISPSRLLWPCVYCGVTGKEPIAAYVDHSIVEFSDQLCQVCRGTKFVELELPAKPELCPACRGWGRTAGRLVSVQEIRRKKWDADHAAEMADAAAREAFILTRIDPRDKDALLAQQRAQSVRGSEQASEDADKQKAQELPAHQPVFCGKCKGIGIVTIQPAHAITIWPYGAPQENTTQKAKRLFGRLPIRKPNN